MTIIIGQPPLHKIIKAALIFASAASYPKTKKPGAWYLACLRLGIFIVYFFLRHTPFKPWADLSRIPIIIVAKKCAHLPSPHNFHIISVSFFH
jgi:hypothetical protein